MSNILPNKTESIQKQQNLDDILKAYSFNNEQIKILKEQSQHFQEPGVFFQILQSSKFNWKQIQSKINEQFSQYDYSNKLVQMKIEQNELHQIKQYISQNQNHDLFRKAFQLEFKAYEEFLEIIEIMEQSSYQSEPPIIKKQILETSKEYQRQEQYQNLDSKIYGYNEHLKQFYTDPITEEDSQILNKQELFKQEEKFGYGNNPLQCLEAFNNSNSQIESLQSIQIQNDQLELKYQNVEDRKISNISIVQQIGRIQQNTFDNQSTINNQVNIRVTNEDKLSPKMLEKIQQILCMKHKKLASEILLDDQLKGQEKLMCSQCKSQQRGPIKSYRIVSALESIQGRKIQVYQRVQKFSQELISGLQNSINRFENYIQSIKNNLQQMIGFSKQSIKNIEDLLQKNLFFSFFAELDSLNINEEILVEREINNLKSKLESIINTSEQQLQIHIEEIQKQASKDNFLRKNDPIIQNVNFTLTNTFKQKEQCSALTFNFDNSILATSCNKFINLWDFKDGQMLQISNVLEGHENVLRSMIFSQTCNRLVSLDNDSLIIIWEMIKAKVWKKTLANRKLGQITNFFMNNEEDQLVLCNLDGCISIQKIDQSYDLVHRQTLCKHQKQVYFACFNKLNSQMVSCSEDGQIVVWQRNQNDLWDFKQVIKKVGRNIQKVQFLSNFSFLILDSQGSIVEYLQEYDEYLERQQLEIGVDSFQNSALELIYNQQTEMLIILQSRQFFFIRQRNHLQMLSILKKPIISDQNIKLFSITRDGNHLVYLTEKKESKFKVFKIQYI